MNQINFQLMVDEILTTKEELRKSNERVTVHETEIAKHRAELDKVDGHIQNVVESKVIVVMKKVEAMVDDIKNLTNKYDDIPLARIERMMQDLQDLKDKVYTNPEGKQNKLLFRPLAIH